MEAPDHWIWENLPEGCWDPTFDSPCEFFEIERRPDLSLWATGTAYSLPSRHKQDLQESVAGPIIDGEVLELEKHGQMTVTCHGAQCLGENRHISRGEPDRFTQKWKCPELESVFRDAEPTHAIDWVLNLRSHHLFPQFTESDLDNVYTRRRSGIDWKSPGSPAPNSSRDHFSISLQVADDEYLVNVGKTNGGPEKWSPGFVEYVDPVPDEAVRRLIRQSLSFTLGGELILIGTTWFDEDGHVVRTHHRAPTFARVTGATKAGRNPMTNISDQGSWQDATWLDEGKIQNITQHLINADDTLCLDDLRRFYFLARRTVMDVGPVMYGSCFEYIRDCIEPNLSTTLLDKKDYRETVRPTLEETLQDVVEEEMLTPGATINDLLHKFSYFHKTSLVAQARELMNHLDLEFGEVEEAALSERNHPAHGRTYNGEKYQVLIRHCRAFQSLLNRLILASTEAAETYIDYSTDNFPERSIEQPLGGPNDDGKPAVLT